LYIFFGTGLNLRYAFSNCVTIEELNNELNVAINYACFASYKTVSTIAVWIVTSATGKEIENKNINVLTKPIW